MKVHVSWDTKYKTLYDLKKIFDRMSKVKATFLLCLVLLHDVFCIHYWKISDDKKRIEAVPDSPYTLAYPGSLVDFLQQVDSVKKFGKTSVELNTVLKSINDRELRDDPEIEQRLRAENEHCKMAGAIGLDRSNFKTSYSAELCPDFHKYYERLEGPDSPYTLAYPGSLVDFLQQVDSVKKFGKTSVELNTVLKSINDRELRDDPEIEQRLRAENEHCKMAGAIGLDRSNFKTSYSAELCPDFHKYYERIPHDELLLFRYTAFVKEYFDMTPDDEKLLPRCRQWHQEGQLRGLPKNENEMRVKIRIPDTDYAEILKGYFPRIKKMVSTESPLYGAIIAALLSNQFDKIKAHPYLHMAAAAYWRQNGDLEEALSCYRTAVVYAENAVAKGDESAQVSLDAIHIAAATLFNKADQPDSAIAILEHSFAVDDTTTRSPCVFLKAQAALADAAYLKLDASRANGIEVEQVADFARVVTYFSEPFMRKLLIPPNDSNYVAELLKLHEVLLKKLGAMSCQIDLFVELAKQKENLDHLVSEKLRFNEVYGDQMKIADQIRGRMISEKMRRSMALGYEEAKYGYNPYRICRTINAKRFPRSNHPGNVVQIYYCDLTDAAAYEESMIPIRKATAKNRPLLNDTAWRVAEVFARDKTFDKKLESLKGKAPVKPQIPKKYPLDSATWSTVRDRFWRRADWPNSVDCQAIVSRTDIFNQKWFPQVFISPENKGYVIADYLTRGIGLESYEEHPLPWREPYCKPVDMLTGLVTAVHTRPSPEYAETRLKSVLVRLADRILEDIEIAQRIRSMMENDVGPRWLSTNLAALYWRVKGNPKQAAYCLIEAILEPYCPTDIALVQLAQ
ncbi:tetratricopeptide repeat protein, partial [Ancylostoma duodenale]